ncbi:hypothetical protein QUF81_24980 [Peribacillus simplex]|uniref:hypothetical protein n=1 Tax=Peribacillus TaxID=2675229 RepID=UPI0025A002D9|nr:MULTISPECIES: hypothetical protein [Peribacillus]MDM5296342.1 hypothetical protein [Peribacillus simplex]MED3690002.1 hypothetical protein [Peribacillus butanolivorans]
MGTLYGLLISFGIIGIQQFLSRRNNAFWGAILPVSYIGFLIWFFLKVSDEFEMLFIIGLTILLGIWSEGRIYLKKKRKKELEKITLQDL